MKTLVTAVFFASTVSAFAESAFRIDDPRVQNLSPAALAEVLKLAAYEGRFDRAIEAILNEATKPAWAECETVRAAEAPTS